MKDSTQGRQGIEWGVMFLIRLLCGRRGAAFARGSIVFCSLVLALLVTLACTYGRWAIEDAWGRFVNMEKSITAIRTDIREYQLSAGYRITARDRQVMIIEQDVDKLETGLADVDRRVIRLEARNR